MRLDEERLTLLHERISVDMCLGREFVVIGELEELCARYPLRETFHEQLMLALSRAGRGAEALRVYTRARCILADEVGIVPGPALRAAQRAILDGHEPLNSLHRPHRVSGPVAEPGSGRCGEANY